LTHGARTHEVALYGVLGLTYSRVRLFQIRRLELGQFGAWIDEGQQNN
jgi:hypothetical protein